MPDTAPLFPRKIEGFSGLSWMAEVELNHLIHLGSFKNNMLEIGTASGVTAAVVSKANPHLKMICVDDFGTSAKEYDEERLKNWHNNHTPQMQLLSSDAIELRNKLHPDLRFDLILIDGDHSYEGCIRDLCIVLPYCEPGITTVVCHDYGDNFHRGVRLAVHEFMYRYPDFRFVNIQHSLIELFYEKR